MFVRFNLYSFMQIYNRFNEVELTSKYNEILLKTEWKEYEEERSTIGSLAAFFEGIGVLVEQGLVDIRADTQDGTITKISIGNLSEAFNMYFIPAMPQTFAIS